MAVGDAVVGIAALASGGETITVTPAAGDTVKIISCTIQVAGSTDSVIMAHQHPTLAIIMTKSAGQITTMELINFPGIIISSALSLVIQKDGTTDAGYYTYSGAKVVD